ncbi:hypothetical protein [Anaeromyxobacter oryzae]|uniref:Uncharacterized protein n=1 Tax=Anaeromyxobacter oryzae TaxID=2918170 RepID=A0ABN6N3G9_9BACT|nr:hypothetical protein [Anaeromyxobacter oryzae]BDG06403.1 hypothetical protein AMOR_53990 [Anaeromyxobacter oryzae]
MHRIPLVVVAATLLVPPMGRAQGPGDPLPPKQISPTPDGAAPLSTMPRPPNEKSTTKDENAAKKAEAKKAEVSKAPLPRAAVLEDVAGTVHAIDRVAHRIEIDTPSGPVGLALDRNTLVYGPNGLVTTLAIQPGSQVRAGRNADFVAYWIAVRAPRPAAPASTPDQGTGPGGGSGAPAEPNSGPAGTTSVPPSTVGPGSATPGSSSPPPGGPEPGR